MVTIFDTHPSFYAWFENDVRALLKSNWHKWQEEKPEWWRIGGRTRMNFDGSTETGKRVALRFITRTFLLGFELK